MKKNFILFLFAGTIGMMFIMADSGKTLSIPPGTAMGILHLEFAYDTSLTGNIIKEWSPASGLIDNITVAKNNTYWDFIFMLFYASFLFFFCRQLARSYTGTFKKAGYFFGAGALIAGLLDVGENIGMLQTLNGNQSNGIALFTTICATLKCLLVVLSVLYAIIAGLGWLNRKYIRKSLN